MILPERVLGNAGAQCSASGEATGPSTLRTQLINSLRSSSDSGTPACKVTKVQIPCPLISCGIPTTAASATASCDTRALSISAVPRRWPETFKTSSTRPVIQ